MRLSGMPCGWRVHRRRCGQPDVAVRNLGPSYGKLRMQPVCAMHASYADSSARTRRELRTDVRDDRRFQGNTAAGCRRDDDQAGP